MTSAQRKTLGAQRKALGEQRAKVIDLIRHELRRRGYDQSRLARELGCSRENVSKVMLGKGHSPLVLDGLRKAGVPEALLFDPRKAREGV